MTGPFGIRKSTNCLGGLVFKASKELVELLHTNSFQEPFSVDISCHEFVVIFPVSLVHHVFA